VSGSEGWPKGPNGDPGPRRPFSSPAQTFGHCLAQVSPGFYASRRVTFQFWIFPFEIDTFVVLEVPLSKVNKLSSGPFSEFPRCY